MAGSVARLALPRLAKDDEGLYTIRVYTKDGTSEHCAYLFVSGGPCLRVHAFAFDQASCGLGAVFRLAFDSLLDSL